MSDRLASLLERFELAARVFYSGELCGSNAFDDADGVGHLHLVRQGVVRVEDWDGAATTVEAPAVVFFARPTRHRLIAADTIGTEVVCASIELGAGAGNPVASSLPGKLVQPVDGSAAIGSLANLLFAEAFARRCGRQAALDRLAELLVIELLRHAIDARLVRAGVLAGLADARLARVLNAIHADLLSPWTLDTMAATAGMSRARFAAHFRGIVGTTPGRYLTEWRLGAAMTLLRQGRPVKAVAMEVGYSTASALARAFSAHRGMSPTQWLERQEHAAAGS